MAATWPDDIKNDHNYTKDGNQSSGPKSARNIGYGDHLQHRYWHIVDRPFSDDGMHLGVAGGHLGVAGGHLGGVFRVDEAALERGVEQLTGENAGHRNPLRRTGLQPTAIEVDVPRRTAEFSYRLR